IQDQEGAASAGTVTDLGALLAFHADVQDRIICAQNRQSEEYNRRHLAWTPSIDDWVLVKTEHYKQRLDPTQRAKAKLSPKLMGPFRVAELIRPGTYQLEVPGPLVGTTEEGSRTERRVSAFLGRRPTQFIDGQRFDYLVKWAGGIEPTWQCDERLPGMHWARRDFAQKIKAEKGISRLTKGREWVLGIAEERARQLRDMEMETKE
ncbi:hypothetical protein CF336_g7875, partial [Tilletia laevis]